MRLRAVNLNEKRYGRRKSATPADVAPGVCHQHSWSKRHGVTMTIVRTALAVNPSRVAPPTY
jgi:hypothetical protein